MPTETTDLNDLINFSFPLKRMHKLWPIHVCELVVSLCFVTSLYVVFHPIGLVQSNVGLLS